LCKIRSKKAELNGKNPLIIIRILSRIIIGIFINNVKNYINTKSLLLSDESYGVRAKEDSEGN
jgi:hypothetical protein